MMEFDAGAFIDTIRAFRALEVTLSEREHTDEGKQFSSQLITGESVVSDIRERLTDFIAGCVALGAVVTQDFISECIEILDEGKLTFSEMTKRTKEMYHVLIKELKRELSPVPWTLS
jgi:hypothetical protein